MEKSNSMYDFDDIRPVYDSEVSDAIEELIASEGIEDALRYVLPAFDWEAIKAKLRTCKTKQQFKENISYDLVSVIAKISTNSLTVSGGERITKDACTFISNHRDIVLDAAFLNVLLFDIGHAMTQITIGDNLLIHPWIKPVFRLNNSFFVKRNLPVRQKLEESKKLSAYIHHTIKETKESVWIAQREGRAKDANDSTQPGLLKMLSMGGDRDALSSLMSLNIVPIAITYEYDPCDYLKAQEFQLKRDNPDYVKSRRDDLLNMEIGILQNKGRVHFTIANPINPKLKSLQLKTNKNEIIDEIASVIDREIYEHYRFFPCNYIAFDLLNDSRRFCDFYNQQEFQAFSDYLQRQIGKIDTPAKDETFLRSKMLEMYSNPLKNHLANKISDW
ncbi:MAG: 1-acyl-sn-glycerol-3-phosphate acyltransferase [Tannerella sp.]|jgi:1-acyl-sn-glycerol-3-phosphate acyltransferase|nr:1-acyl-sn-glycerol-3-phosphate acyltransferase [Tannerella sp.]